MDLAWVGGRAALERYRAAPRTSIASGFRAFSEAGVFVAAQGSEGEESQVCVTAGPARVRASAGHMHADQLSFSWYVAGYEVVGDPGTLCYAGSSESRDRLRASASHSTAHPEGEELRGLLGGFRTGPGRRAQVVVQGNDWSGHLRLESGFEITRRIEFEAPERLSLEDVVVDESGRRIEWALMLGSGALTRRDVSPHLLDLHQVTPVGGLTLRIESSAPVEWELDSVVGSYGYGVPREMGRVRAYLPGAEGGTIRSVMCLSRHPQS